MLIIVHAIILHYTVHNPLHCQEKGTNGEEGQNQGDGRYVPHKYCKHKDLQVAKCFSKLNRYI